MSQADAAALAGAGSPEISDPDERPRTTAIGDGLLLTDEDGAKWATKSGFASYFHPGKRLRLSLAGAQNKLAVLETEGGLAVPTGGQPSTHLLEPPNPDDKGLVENEAVMLSVAKTIGLPVVEHEVVTLGQTRRGTDRDPGSTRGIPASPAGREDPRIAGVNGICGRVR